jgi:DNA (cytosine-5)-methyltransferase 1
MTRAWHFLQSDWTAGSGNEPLWIVGETRQIKQSPVLCLRGYHASQDILDALRYAPGPVACLVEPLGEIVHGGDKLVSQGRRLIAGRGDTGGAGRRQGATDGDGGGSVSKLVLSIFPGIDLLGRAFEEVFGADICLVRGPDPIFGGDIRGWHVPSGVFWGIVGGPPCQDFSALSAINRHLGRVPRFGNLIPEFERVVDEARPDWFLMENVERAPKPSINGYQVSDLVLDNRWLGEEQSRRRRFSFGSADGRELVIDGLVVLENIAYEPAVVSTTGYLLGNGGAYLKSKAAVARCTASRKRPVERLCELQGVDRGFFQDSPFTVGGKRKAIANAVPMEMGRALARAIKRAMEATS